MPSAELKADSKKSHSYQTRSSNYDDVWVVAHTIRELANCWMHCKRGLTFHKIEIANTSAFYSQNVSCIFLILEALCLEVLNSACFWSIDTHPSVVCRCACSLHCAGIVVSCSALYYQKFFSHLCHWRILSFFTDRLAAWLLVSVGGDIVSSPMNHWQLEGWSWYNFSCLMSCSVLDASTLTIFTVVFMQCIQAKTN